MGATSMLFFFFFCTFENKEKTKPSERKFLDNLYEVEQQSQLEDYPKSPNVASSQSLSKPKNPHKH